MKIEVTTNANAIEKVNYILSQALQSLRDDEKKIAALDLSPYDIEIAETFRKQLLKGFFKASK